MHQLDGIDVVAIQEPYITFLKTTVATAGWTTVYPSTHLTNDKKSRSLLMINSQLDSDSWEEIAFQSPDITAIAIRSMPGRIRIFNVYLDGKSNIALRELDQYLKSHPKNANRECPTMDIIQGDMNRHHPMWDEERNQHLFTNTALSMAEPLITMINKHDWSMALPKDIPTLEAFNSKNLTRPDNVFCSTEYADRVIVCETQPDKRPPYTDHFPIRLTIDATMQYVEYQPRLDFAKVKWPEYREALTMTLQGLGTPEPVQNIEEFEKRLSYLNAAIDQVNQDKVPMTKPSPRSKRWWTPELETMRKSLLKKGREVHRNNWKGTNEQEKAEFRKQRAAYGEAIKEQKNRHWADWLTNMSSNSSDIWTTASLVTNAPTDGSRARVPTLITKDEDGVAQRLSKNSEKSLAFHKAFFPLPRTDPIETEHEHEEPATHTPWPFQLPTDMQIMRTFQDMAPGKATKEGTPSNDLLKNCADILSPHIGPLYRASIELGYYPDAWAFTKTIITRKPGKPNYQDVNAWRPLSISNGFGRGLCSVITQVISHECETRGLIPAGHYGSRPGRSAPDAVLELVSTVKDAWRQKNVVTGLFLDVKGAFPSVDLPTLYSTLRRKNFPEKLVQWLEARLARRTTQICFDDHISEIYATYAGLDQGDPLSAVLYILYNSSLLEVACTDNGETSLGYVDDVTFLVEGTDFKDTHSKMQHMITREDGILAWAKKHNCEFSIPKFQVVDFTRKLEPAIVVTPHEGTQVGARASTTAPNRGNINSSGPELRRITDYFTTTSTRHTTPTERNLNRLVVRAPRQTTSSRQPQITAFLPLLHATEDRDATDDPKLFPQRKNPPHEGTAKRVRRTVRGEAIQIGERKVSPSSSAKLLGIHIDAKLRWHEQFAACLGKAENWLRQFTRLTKTNSGLTAHNITRLWSGTAIPRIYYGAEVYIAPVRATKNSRGRLE